MKFEWIPGLSGPKIERPANADYEGPPALYLHISSDDYEPDLMTSEEDGVYSNIRMVPPGPLKYYYSVGEEVMTAEDKPVVQSN
jgi:hypothetical protein